MDDMTIEERFHQIKVGIYKISTRQDRSPYTSETIRKDLDAIEAHIKGLKGVLDMIGEQLDSARKQEEKTAIENEHLKAYIDKREKVIEEIAECIRVSL